MIVDSSAIMSILREEVDAEAMLTALASADRPRISAGNWIELAAVLTRAGDAEVARVAEALFERFRIAIEAVSVAQAAIGRAAYGKYGRGTASKAKLNFGDCFAYALAKEAGEPLLYKGDDFVHTDIASAV